MAKTGYMTIRIPQEVLSRVRTAAEQGTRTIAAQVLHYVLQGLARDKK